MTRTMAKKRGASDDEETPKQRKIYPSRLKTKYVALPKHYYAALEEYAKRRSDADDDKSVSWAARVAVRRLMDAEGIDLAPLGEDDKDL